MAKPRLLSSSQILKALPGLHGWRLARGALRCDFRFESFRQALQFVNKVAALAEAADHHPDIDIRYSLVRLALCTHDVGGISDRDLALARQIDGLSAVRKSV